MGLQGEIFLFVLNKFEEEGPVENLCFPEHRKEFLLLFSPSSFSLRPTPVMEHLYYGM